MELAAVFRQEIDTPFHQQPSTTWRWEKEDHPNPIVLGEDEDKENSPPATLMSDRPTELPRLLRSSPFVGRIENVPEFV